MMRQATLEKRAVPIVAWLRDEYRRTGFHPRHTALWYRCCAACSTDKASKQRENALQLNEYVLTHELTEKAHA
jgi:hypothetical protein